MATLITSRSESVWHYLNPIAMVRNLWQHRDLIRQFTKREIEGRYKGSFLGLFWSVVNPLVLLLIYTFVFGIILQSRWPQSATNSLGEFAVVAFCGMIVFNIFSECISRAPIVVVSVPNYVKKVVFPVEILLVSVLGVSIFQAIISTVILLIAQVVFFDGLSINIFLIPILILPLFMLCLGIGWFLASLGVFIRDVTYMVALILQILFFLSPIFYSVEAVPAEFRSLILTNPLTSIIDNTRRVVFWGTSIDWFSWGLWIIIAFIIMILGYAWFMSTKRAFADVL